MKPRPSSAPGLSVVTALFADGKTDEAVEQMRIAAEIRPSIAGSYGGVPIPADQKQIDDGIALWNARLHEKPDDVSAHNNLGVLLAQKHHARAAIGEWEKALQLAPQDGNAQSNLAWARATAPDHSLRDGVRAVSLAENVVKLAGEVNPLLHRTLAAAYAEAGRFDDAASAATQGQRFAEREGNQTLAAELASNLARYKLHQPLRDESLQE